MPLLDRSGGVVADAWVALADDAALPAAGSVILPINRLTGETVPNGHEGQLGVLLATGAALDAVLPWLSRLSLVAVPFPGFRDGRGFTAARALREQHGFTGEIRACGHLLPDQYVALLRVGVSTVELPEDADPSVWVKALRLNGEFSSRQPLPWIRRATVTFQVA